MESTHLTTYHIGTYAHVWGYIEISAENEEEALKQAKRLEYGHSKLQFQQVHYYKESERDQIPALEPQEVIDIVRAMSDLQKSLNHLSDVLDIDIVGRTIRIK